MTEHQSEKSNEETREVDHLKYIGNNVPRFLRLAWTVFFFFMFYYLARYAWPNLQDWMQR